MRSSRTSIALAAVLCVAVSTGAWAAWPEGVAAFKAGQWSKAEAEFKAIVEGQPDWPGGHFMLGWTYLKQGKSSEAITHLRKAYDLNSDDVNTQLRLGEAYVAAGRYNDAVAFLGKINAASLPREMQGYLAQLRGVAYTKTGQSDSALGEFSRAAKSMPNDASVQYQYGTAAYNAGETSVAVAALGRASQLEPNDMTMMTAYAKALNRQGREVQGSGKQSAYTKAADAAKKVVSRNASFDNLMLLGEAQLGAKQYDAAVSTFQQALGKNSGDWLPSFYIGQAHTATGKYGSAETALRQALDKTSNASNQTRIWRQLGFVYEKQQNFDESIRAYRRAGDEASARRVSENKEISQYNKDVEQEAEQLRKLQEEQERIKKELEGLSGRPPR